MPIASSPQPFQPKPRDSLGKRTLWLMPGLLALVFVVIMAVWAEGNDAQLQRAYEKTLLADAQSVQAQLTARRDMELARLREVALRLPTNTKDANQALAGMPDVVAGLDRLWNRLVWLDENNQVVARAERKAPMLTNATEELRVQSSGQADHFAVPVLDVNARPIGKMLARFDIADLLQSTDLVWLNHRYEVNFLSELGEVIATTASPLRPPMGISLERPL
jgi:hypothetical protein